jgi:bifunctional non-homologous end joining protein LigD
MSASIKTTLDVSSTKVEVSNLKKVLYPEVGFTKGDVIDYYIRISKHLLPHLKNRPITLKRYPDGVDGFFFYEKQCPPHRPKWIKTTNVPKSDGSEIHYCVMNDLPALVWAANLADLELHTFLHRAPAIDRPTALAFDLDPGAPADIVQCCQVGVLLKAVFDSLGLKSFAKTSGSKGLQVYVPLNTPGVTYEKTKAFAHALAILLENQAPDLVVSKMQKNLRRGKVLVDWSQNDDHKTTVNVYSLRAKAHPTVSTPVTWDEVTSALKKKSAKALVFETRDVLKRVEKLGDLFEPVLTLKQKLPPLSAVGG